MGFGVVSNQILVGELIQYAQIRGGGGDAQQRHGLVQNGEGLLTGDQGLGTKLRGGDAGDQTVGAGPGNGGGIVICGGYISEIGGLSGYGGTVQSAVKHQNKVAPGDGVIPAKLSGGNAADDAVLIAILHRGVGPVVRGDVGVDIAQRDRDVLGDAARFDGDSAAVAGAVGGKQAVLGDGAHAAAHRPGHAGGRAAAQGVTGPVGSGGGELYRVACLHGQGGQGAGTARLGDVELGQGGDHVDLGGAVEAQRGGVDLNGVGAALGAGGIDRAVKGAQTILRGELCVGDPGIDGFDSVIDGDHVAQGDTGAGQYHQAVLLQSQPGGRSGAGVVGDQKNKGGAAAGVSAGGGVLNVHAVRAGQTGAEDGGAAAVQVDRPLAALLKQLVGQILFTQTAGVAGLTAVYLVQHQSAVCLDAQGGAGVAAILAIDPLGAVGNGAVAYDDVARAAGPLGIGEDRVRAGGGQGDPVAHMVAGKDLIKARLIGRGENVVIFSDGDGVGGLKDVDHFQGQGAVDGKVGAFAVVNYFKADHTAAGRIGLGGDGGKIFIIKVETAGGVAPLIKMGQLHSAVVPLVGEGDVYLGRDRQGDLSVDGGHGVVALGAGFVDAVLNGDAKRNAAVSEKVTVDAADDVIAHTFRVADGLVNGGRAVGCARGLDHDGVDIAVGAELEGVTLHPPGGGMLGYGVDISQTVGKGLRGGQPTGPSRGIGGWKSERCGQKHCRSSF